MKALALLSGGLDSTLAIKLMLEQWIEVEALNFSTIFCQCTSKHSSCGSEAKRVSETFGIPIKVINHSEVFLEIVKQPRYGYGSHMNPCIDCRILMFKTAAGYMKQSGASFLITGEVLGQRPMSQHLRALKLIEKETGLEGLILRPLSARVLEPTIPEQKGWVNREKLLAIKGRSRKEQISLAGLFELKDYPCPSGGCLLTDPGFSRRVKDVLTYGDLTVNEGLLLKYGRHFRLDNQTKLAVGRNEPENKILLSLTRAGDLIIEIKNCPGPVAILRGGDSEPNIKLAAAITARYADLSNESGEAEVRAKDNKTVLQTVKVVPLSTSDVKKYLIAAEEPVSCCGGK